MADEKSPAARLRRACGSLAIQLLPAQEAALLSYLGLLQKWNATYNLTSIRDPVRMLTHHIVDSLAVVPHLRRHLLTTPAHRVVDAGSGAGLPGAVLAMVFPELRVTCIDSVGKKASFVRQVAAEIPVLNLESLHSRLEILHEPRADVITSRAFATLADMVQATRNLLAPGGVWLAMKGRNPQSEITGLPADIETFHVEQIVVPELDAERCVVWLRKAAA